MPLQALQGLVTPWIGCNTTHTSVARNQAVVWRLPIAGVNCWAHYARSMLQNP